MSQNVPGSPNDRIEEKHAAPSGAQEQRSANSPSRRRSSVRFFRDAVRRLQQYDRKQKVNRGEKWARIYWRMAWKRLTSPNCIRRFQLAALFVASGVFFWVWYSKELKADTIIAFLTVVITYTTWLGWRAMRDQNDIMRDQMHQTDRMLSHMREERRPWLRVLPFIGPLLVDKEVACGLKIHNSGDTPASITTVTSALAYQDAGRGFDQVRDECFPSSTLPSIANALVPPGIEISYTLPIKVKIEQSALDLLRAGTTRFYLIGKFAYHGLEQGQGWETGFAFALDVSDGSFDIAGGNEDNYMK